MNHFTCPACGARYRIVPEGEGEMKKGNFARLFGRGKGEFEASKPWQAHVAQPAALPQVVAKPLAQHDPVMVRFVRLPLVQAVISGFYWAWVPTGIAVVVLAAIKAKIWWWLSIPIILAISTLAVSGRYWFKLYEKDRETLEFIERFTGLDLNNKDGSVGPPKTIRIERVDREKRSIHYDDLPVDEDTLREVAHAVLQLRCNISNRGLAEHTSLSVEKAAELLAAMRGAGFARFNTKDKPNSGTALTKDGLDLLEEVL